MLAMNNLEKLGFTKEELAGFPEFDSAPNAYYAYCYRSYDMHNLIVKVKNNIMEEQVKLQFADRVLNGEDVINRKCKNIVINNKLHELDEFEYIEVDAQAIKTLKDHKHMQIVEIIKDDLNIMDRYREKQRLELARFDLLDIEKEITGKKAEVEVPKEIIKAKGK